MSAAFTDEQLINALARGETWVMAALYDRYGRLVFSLAYQILRDRATAEECVQEVFVKVWRRAHDYTPERGKFSSWLTGIAHHHAIDELRRRRVRPAASEDETAALEIPDDAPAPHERAVQSLEHRRIRDALGEIPNEQRVPIELAYFEGFTQQEIADRLAQPLGTIKTRMRLGMQKLKTLLDDRS
jgi:RNA polymerase sigma-70 factor, ECF subfamily